MKKLLAIGTLSLISSLAMADRAIILQPGEPLPMGAKIDRQYYDGSSISQKSQPQNQSKSERNTNLMGISLFAGYSGQNAKPEYEGKQKLNGFELGASYYWGDFGVYEKYEHQNESQIKYNEMSTGVQYKFLKQNNAYLMGTAALGYGWGETKETKIDLEFLTLPVGLEAGYSFTPNFDLYGGVGYKWLWDRTENVGCSMYVCWSGRGDVVGDTDGVTYKAGLRYNF